MKYVLFNPRSNNNRGKAAAEELKAKLGECEFQDVTKLNSYKNFFEYLSRDDKVYLVGGDGTLNYFINEMGGAEILPELYFYAAGTGNDFLNDVSPESKEPIKINEFLKNLPTVIVKGQAYKFINGVGYGLDGMCCQVGDDLRAKSDKPVNYTSIAIKQVLYAYKPKKAKVTV
ncbi:MAG TPA: diacylglycerol kinase family protein, partial [Clostridiales bacterium]|nr:diacylglycerol kinase family protein [Clostridiales bacterium]